MVRDRSYRNGKQLQSALGFPYFHFCDFCNFEKASLSQIEKIRPIATPAPSAVGYPLDYRRTGICHWLVAAVGGIGGTVSLFDGFYWKKGITFPLQPLLQIVRQGH